MCGWLSPIRICSIQKVVHFAVEFGTMVDMSTTNSFLPKASRLQLDVRGLTKSIFCGVVWMLSGLFASSGSLLAVENRVDSSRQSERIVSIVQNFCLDCHNAVEPTAEIDLETLLDNPLAEGNSQADFATWEKVVRKIQAGQMPPPNAVQPEAIELTELQKILEQRLDAAAAQQPAPGRTETFRRLTRYEYQNSIRDLLGLEIDAAELLPADEISHGFDNITVGELSPTLVNRYISAAEKISRLALGRTLSSPEVRTVRVPPDRTQEQHVYGLPLGTRGGTLIEHYFPRDGEYEIRVRLTRDRNEHVEGLSEPHQLEVLLDHDRVELFTVKPPRGGESEDGYAKVTHENVDQHLTASLRVKAGEHRVGVTFIKKTSSLLETQRQPLNVHYNMYRHPRIGPAVYQVSITGPLAVEPLETRGFRESASRQKILICEPKDETEEVVCAEKIITNLLRIACRGRVTEADLRTPMELFRQGREAGDFEGGIELALSGVLVNPRFLFRIERQPEGMAAGQVYEISDLELATRLSFFLWSSLPDKDLLELAESGQLRNPDVLREQVRRMLSDDRGSSLVENFAAQWLYLRNLDSLTPDARLYPDFDDNLRQAFREETERFVDSIFREDRSVLELLRSDYTFLNERLAKHYQVPHVFGSHFRRVDLEPESRRGGLLRHGSILSVTSYATRTSPVIRGKWILENILGTPTPPPPPNIPALADNTVSSQLRGRDRLAMHRENPACASCHNIIDPIGFSLENFDALGQWRELENGNRVASTGGLPDGSEFEGISGLEDGLLRRPDVFVTTLAERLLTYALGRGLEPSDGPAIRKIVRDTENSNYRFSSMVEGIVNSIPFQMRTAQ